MMSATTFIPILYIVYYIHLIVVGYWGLATLNYACSTSVAIGKIQDIMMIGAFGLVCTIVFMSCRSNCNWATEFGEDTQWVPLWYLCISFITGVMGLYFFMQIHDNLPGDCASEYQTTCTVEKYISIAFCVINLFGMYIKRQSHKEIEQKRAKIALDRKLDILHQKVGKGLNELAAKKKMLEDTEQGIILAKKHKQDIEKTKAHLNPYLDLSIDEEHLPSELTEEEEKMVKQRQNQRYLGGVGGQYDWGQGQYDWGQGYLGGQYGGVEMNNLSKPAQAQVPDIQHHLLGAGQQLAQPYQPSNNQAPGPMVGHNRYNRSRPYGRDGQPDSKKNNLNQPVDLTLDQQIEAKQAQLAADMKLAQELEAQFNQEESAFVRTYGTGNELPKSLGPIFEDSDGKNSGSSDDNKSKSGSSKSGEEGQPPREYIIVSEKDVKKARKYNEDTKNLNDNEFVKFIENSDNEEDINKLFVIYGQLKNNPPERLTSGQKTFKHTFSPIVTRYNRINNLQNLDQYTPLLTNYIEGMNNGSYDANVVRSAETYREMLDLYPTVSNKENKTANDIHFLELMDQLREKMAPRRGRARPAEPPKNIIVSDDEYPFWNSTIGTIIQGLENQTQTVRDMKQNQDITLAQFDNLIAKIRVKHSDEQLTRSEINMLALSNRLDNAITRSEHRQKRASEIKDKDEKRHIDEEKSKIDQKIHEFEQLLANSGGFDKYNVNDSKFREITDFFNAVEKKKKLAGGKMPGPIEKYEFESAGLLIQKIEQAKPKGSPHKGSSPKGSPHKGNSPKGNPPKGNPPKGNPPKGNPPKGNPPKGNPPKGNPPKGNPPKGRPKTEQSSPIFIQDPNPLGGDEFYLGGDKVMLESQAFQKEIKPKPTSWFSNIFS
jgi:hypothetical protein